MKYIIYLRVSTDKQDVDSQLMQCMEYIKKTHGDSAFDFETFSDPDVSARKIKLEERAGIQAAIASIKKGDTFLAVCVDRLGRNLLECFKIREMIKARKGSIVLVTQPYMADNDIIWGVSAGLASEELKQITFRTKSALAAKKARGERTGEVPYGYTAGIGKRNREGRMVDPSILKVNPREVEVIQLIQDLRASNLTYREISHELEARGIRNRRGNPFYHSQVFYILKNRQRHLDMIPVQ